MIFPRHHSLTPHSLNFTPILLCPMPCLFPVLPHQKARSLCQCNSHAPCLVSCCLSCPISHIMPSLVSHCLSYHAVSCIVPSLILSYCPVSCIAPSLMSSLTPVTPSLTPIQLL